MRVLHGDRKDRINDNEPRPRPREKPPSCPSHLKGEARREWRRRASDLFAKGLLTDWDLQLFEQWCIQCHVYHQAYDAWARDDFAPTIESYRGQRVKHPALQSMRDAAATMLSISKRFGFTPADRAGIDMPEIPDGEALELMTPTRVRDPRP